MEYDLIPVAEQEETIANAIRERQREHFHYQLNKDNYTNILTQLDAMGLPEEWPENLAKFKTLGSTQLAAVLKGADFELANNLAYRDKVRSLISTETAEQIKCETAYKALCDKLPDKQAVVDALARIDVKAAEKVT